MYAKTVKMIRDDDADALARLMGGNVARRRRIVKTRKTRGSLPLAGLVDRRMALRGVYRAKTYRATLRKDGRIGYNGHLYESPTAAAKAIVGRVCNGWNFWHYRIGRNSWVPLKELRR